MLIISLYALICRQIDRDCQFLEGERIMDYSLLVGIHFREDNAGDKMGLSPFLLRTGILIILSRSDCHIFPKLEQGC